MSETIARETLFGQRACEDRFPITIEIGRPYKYSAEPSTEWVCSVKASPLATPPDAHGEGSFQALCLAIYLVRFTLANFMDEGGILSFEDGQAFVLNNFWPSIDLS